MTDLEKWHSFLTEMHIPHHVDDDRPAIEIGCDDNGKPVDNYDDLFEEEYCPGLKIVFNKDGSFARFWPSGE